MPLPKILIVTNNPDVQSEHPDHVMFVNGGVFEVFCAVRDMIHLGSRLITHPMSGSIKPNVTPYKSVIVTKDKAPMNYQSLQIIEDAIVTFNKMIKPNYTYNEATLDDFRVIDLDIINSAMTS